MKKKTVDHPVSVSITSRHMDVTPALRDYAVTKISRLQKYFDPLMEAHIIVSTEKLNRTVEVNISANGFKISSKGKTPDVFASVDNVVEKLERQLKKYREKFQERKRVAAREKMANKEKSLPLVQDKYDEEFSGPEIVKIEKVSQKPMSADEAAMQMDLIQKPFFAFINSQTDDLNIIYRRNDGNYALITRR